MTLDLTELTESTQNRMLQVVETLQGTVLGGVQAWSSSVQKVQKMLPLDTRVLDRLPGASVLPAPDKMVELSYSFASKVLANQQHFAEQLVGITAPVSRPAARTSRTAAAKPAATPKG